jgi:hypothetical protein
MDAITDDSNLWLRATRTQDSGDYLGAFSMYLLDASNCLAHSSLNRAALSCSCAADCIRRLGVFEEVRTLYLESAILYESSSNMAIGNSVREALWLLLQTYDHLVLSSDEENAERVYRKYMSLARRTNPIDGEAEASRTLRARKHTAHLEPGKETPESFEPITRIRSEIERFRKLRSQVKTSSIYFGTVNSEYTEDGAASHIEASIVS